VLWENASPLWRRREVDCCGQGRQHLKLAIGRQGHQILDRTELPEVAAGGGGNERTPTGHAEDQILSHQILKGAAHSLATYGVPARNLNLSGQRHPEAIVAPRDLRPEILGNPAERGRLRRNLQHRRILPRIPGVLTLPGAQPFN